MFTQTPLSILNAIEYCLKPIVRLCIQFGIDYRQISEILKINFVSVAEEEFYVLGKSQTDSRITLLTGVHRKDVRRIRSESFDKSLRHHQNLISSLITKWQTTPELLDQDGNPQPIPRTNQPDYSISFTELAASLTNDIHPRAIMDECIFRGLIKLSENNMVHLIIKPSSSTEDFDNRAYRFGQNIHTYITTAANNLSKEKPQPLNIVVHKSEPKGVASK